MQLIDSNILIYSAKPEYSYLRNLIVHGNYVSLISKVEVLGFHKLIVKEENYFKACFKVLSNISVDDNVVEKPLN